MEEIKKRLDNLEKLNKNKSTHQNILVFLFFAISITMIVTSRYDSKIGSYVMETKIIKEGNTTTTISHPVTIDNSKHTNKNYLRDTSPIYYGFFILLFLISILIFLENKKCKTIEYE